MAIAKRLHHTAVVTKDMDMALEFYENILGLEVASCVTIEDQQVKSAVLKCGGEPSFEIVEFLDGRDYNYVDGYFEVAAFQVDDIEKSIIELKEKGVEFLMDEPFHMGENDSFIFFRGPSGEKLELIQIDDKTFG